MIPFVASVTTYMPSSGVLGMLTLLAALVWIALDAGDKRRPRVFLFVALIPVYGWICDRVLRAENALMPEKFDGVLYRVDQALGLAPAAIAEWLQTGLRYAVLDSVYRSLLLAMALWYAVDLRHRKGPSILWAYATEMFVGPCLYALLPACGPIYAFAGYPHGAVNASLRPLALSGDPNAIPSLHMATAFLLVIFARSWRWRAGAIVFATATALATIANGEHYAIDLVVGLAFGCFAAAAAHRRFGLAAASLGTVVAWMTAIRWAAAAVLANPGALRFFAALTVAGACWAASQLGTESRREPAASPALIPEPAQAT
jgi:hypothetical protein